MTEGPGSASPTARVLESRASIRFWWFSLFQVLYLIAARLVAEATVSWCLISLVPFVGPLVLLVITLLDAEPGSNAYGPSPKLGGVAPHPD